MQLEIGKIYEGKVTGITKFGAFVELEPGTTGMVHISEIANTYVSEIKDHIQEGETVKVKVLTITPENKISLSIKQTLPPAPKKEFKKDFRSNNNGGGSAHFSKPVAKVPVAPPPVREVRGPSGDCSFEDMLSKFKQNSEEKQSDLKKIIDNKRKSPSRRCGGK